MQVSMYISFWNFFFFLSFLVVSIAVIAMAGMALGAFCVFRTKRESHESFFSMRAPQGDAGVSPSEFDEPQGHSAVDEASDRLYGRLKNFFSPGEKAEDIGYLSDPGVDEEVYPDSEDKSR